jgi:hypothetical protein
LKKKKSEPPRREDAKLGALPGKAGFHGPAGAGEGGVFFFILAPWRLGGSSFLF